MKLQPQSNNLCYNSTNFYLTPFQKVIEELEKKGHVTERYSNRGSIINALYQNESGIYGVSDYRKLGEVIGF